MSNTLRCALVMFVALSLLAAGCNVEASNSRPPRNNDISTIEDALKYLHELDTFYGDRARVRFGKRDPLMQLLHSRLVDNNGINNSNNNGPDLNHVGADFANVEEIF